DLRTQRGVVGAASYPWQLYLGLESETAKKLFPNEKPLVNLNLKRVAAAPKRHQRRELDKVAKPFLKDAYKQTKTATGGYGAKKAKEFWHDNPVGAIGSTAVIIAPAARLAGIGALGKEIATL